MKTYLDGIKNINKVGNAVDEIYMYAFTYFDFYVDCDV